MRAITWAAGLLAAAGFVAMAGCGGTEPGTGGEKPLLVYVGGTMRPPMVKLTKMYTDRTGVPVELDYGDSGSNMIKAETTRRGDLYVAHDPFHAAMMKKGLATEGWAVATIWPMIAVPKGNPKEIHGLADLAKPGMRVVLTDAQYSTVGHINPIMFRKAGVEEAIEKNVVSRPRSGGDAANAVILGTADAAIVWNAVIHVRGEELDAVPIAPQNRPDPAVDAVTTATFGKIDMSTIKVVVDLLASSEQKEKARALAEFLASDEARKVWEEMGFGPPPEPAHLTGEGESAAAAPTGAAASLNAYVGAGLRPAMVDLVAAWREKTGQAVECDYGGSGVIISRLRLSDTGDLFMPGDVWYVDLAAREGLIDSKRTVAYFVPVILVARGNPKAITSLADLARPGVRLGLGNPKACQVGRVSEQIIEKNGLDRAAIDRNLAFSSATVNELGIQVDTGHLDAAIVWDAIAALYPDTCEAVAIPPDQNVISEVAVAVLERSTHKGAPGAFAEFLTGPEAGEIFRPHQYRTEPPK